MWYDSLPLCHESSSPNNTGAYLTSITVFLRILVSGEVARIKFLFKLMLFTKAPRFNKNRHEVTISKISSV